MTGLELSVLGAVRVSRDGDEVDLGTPRQRAIIAALALADGRPLPVAAVIERVWGADAPAAALATLHGYVAALRRALEPDRPPRTPATVLVTHADAYSLEIPLAGRDEFRFQSALEAARELLSVVPDHLRPRIVPHERETVEAALDQVDLALSLWRGTPYAELGEHPAAVAHRARLEDLRRMAEELRVVGRLALGLHDVVRAELEAQTARHPLHERWWALRAVALAREDRRADALAVLDELRDRLAEELGVDPSPPLQALHAAILRQDPSVVAAEVDPPQPRPTGALQLRREPWTMLGRDPELADLRSALDDSLEGRPGFVVLTGEPGIGKSRLAAELAETAAQQGCSVAVGQCSQDDGAPPLSPWLSALQTLGRPFAAPEAGQEAGGLFRVRADVARAVCAAAAEQPVLLVLEDLHWADPSTLGVLRLLAESVTHERLLVVATWRTQTEVGRDLGAVAEALARRHAVRRELTGLDVAGTRGVVAEVAGVELGAEAATELHQRTGGNPLFVVEFARLAAADSERDVAELLDDPALPTAVAEVVGRRIDVLPDVTVTVLRTAAIIGRGFDLDTLAAVTRMQEDELLDAVEPAADAGLLHEEGVDVFRFSHALVRDVLCATMTASRLARTHALVAELLEDRVGREAEAASHWRAAGPAYVSHTWRALAVAAEAATRVYAYPDAAELLEEALELQAADPAADLRDRAGLLQQAIDVYRWAAMLPELIVTVERAIATAEELDDVTLLARAATQTSHRMLWRSAAFGTVHEGVVGALRRALQELPPDETELRCRVLMSLANELRENASIAERALLCDEAVAMAHRLGDPALVCDVLLHTAMSTWVPATADARVELVAEAVVLARDTHQDHALVMGLTMLTVMLGELGRPDEMMAALRDARAQAARLRVVYAELVLDEVELAWSAAAGRLDHCEVVLAAIEGRIALMSRTGGDEELSVDRHIDTFALRIWQGRPLDAAPDVIARIESGYPMQPFAIAALWRGGDRDAATARFSAHELAGVLDQELAFSTPLWCQTAEVALYFQDTGLAERAYERLTPYAGRASGPDGLLFGPVDAFLAMAARGAGDRQGAARHADRALELIDAWGLASVRSWLEGVRTTYDF
ncbi:BTAD domain-containing putative transcriptional regulator [Nocardioides sp. URHA0020]|uniref:BTAD domain-containing putative transcriptional regulator n=1 Tax=Nocardioides sp. URHA0020 TaxID=1380392 RepID=UPI000564D6A5|nr:BTAD domain-containing putative transcriptional regulator [Nocardioides sp. URHA0020]